MNNNVNNRKDGEKKNNNNKKFLEYDLVKYDSIIYNLYNI